MIPLSRDAVKLTVWKTVTHEENGDVWEEHQPTSHAVMASVYPLTSSKVQGVEGQDIQSSYRILFNTKPSTEVCVGYMLGTRDEPIYSLTEVKVSGNRASCIGVRS